MRAAEHLEGLSLEGGWNVIRRLPRHESASGGNFSESYVVEGGGRQGFLKAFDFSDAFDQEDPARVLQFLTSAYNFEREIVEHCAGKRMSHVVVGVGHGQVQIPGMGRMEGRVFYLIFEKAQGDVRVQMDINQSCDDLWCMRALSCAALGLWQIHRELIAHQDTKPSNVLHYGGGVFKIADFGRSSRRGQPGPFDELIVAGDRTYAPPELLYGFQHQDFGPRRFGCDLYMLGNLAAFLFAGGINVTSMLVARLDPHHHPQVWRGTYAEMLPYLHRAFSQTLTDIRPRIHTDVRDDVLSLISELCNPELDRRGHPKGVGRHDQYSLQRYVTHLDLLTHKLSVKLRNRAS